MSPLPDGLLKDFDRVEDRLEEREPSDSLEHFLHHLGGSRAVLRHNALLRGVLEDAVDVIGADTGEALDDLFRVNP